MNVSECFDKYQLKYANDFPTSQLSSIKTGGIAKHIVYPENIGELILAINVCLDCSVRYKLIGGCTNTFFSDEGFVGVIISVRNVKTIDVEGTQVVAEAGAPLVSVLKQAAERGVCLASELFGIPGSIGGAIRNNAGAFGAAISDIFEYGSFYDTSESRILELGANDISFSYRSSILQMRNVIFLKGVFKGKRCGADKTFDVFKDVIMRRRSSQPSESSLGSFFKRSGDVIPAILIEKAGLKGLCVGGASVSLKHSGFIINKGNATSSDVDALANHIEKTIFEKYNAVLVREAEYVK